MQCQCQTKEKRSETLRMDKKPHQKHEIVSKVASYVCLESNCGKAFSSKSALNRHKRCHLMQAKSVEVGCDEAANRHEVNPDTKDIIYICLERGCGAQFGDELKYDQHLNTQVSGSTSSISKCGPPVQHGRVWKNIHDGSPEDELTAHKKIEENRVESESNHQEANDSELNMGRTRENVVKIEPYTYLDMPENIQTGSMNDALTQPHFSSKHCDIYERTEPKEQHTRDDKMDVEITPSATIKIEPYCASDMHPDSHTVPMNRTVTDPLCSEVKSEQVSDCEVDNVIVFGSKAKSDADPNVDMTETGQCVSETGQCVSTNQAVATSLLCTKAHNEQWMNCKVENSMVFEVKNEPYSPCSDLDMKGHQAFVSTNAAMTSDTADGSEALRGSKSMEDDGEDCAPMELSITSMNNEQRSPDREVDANECENMPKYGSPRSSTNREDTPSRKLFRKNTSNNPKRKISYKSEVKCPLCEYSITHPSKIVRHLIRHNQVPCVVCGRKTFKPENDDDPAVCCDDRLANRYFLAAKSLIKRSRGRAPNSRNVSETPLVSALRVNLSKIVGNFTEADDQNRQTTNSGSSDQVLKCSKCPDFTTSKKCGLNYHNNISHDIIKCSKCSDKLLLHYDRKRSLCQKCRKPNPKRNDKTYLCSYCNTSLSTPFARKKHVEAVHLKLSVGCPVDSCAKKYLTRSGLVGHLKRRHASEEIIQELQCDECDYIAIEKEKLTFHITMNHKSMKGGAEENTHTQYSTTSLSDDWSSSDMKGRQPDSANGCENMAKCGSSTSSTNRPNDSSRKLLRSKTPENLKWKNAQREVKCPKCGYSSKDQRQIVRHFMRHNQFPCVVCGRKTFKPENEGDPVVCCDDRLKRRYLLAVRALIRRIQCGVANDPHVSKTLLLSALEVSLSRPVGSCSGADDNQSPTHIDTSGHVLACPKCPGFSTSKKCGLNYHNKMLHDIIKCSKCNTNLLLEIDRKWSLCQKCRKPKSIRNDKLHEVFLCSYCNTRFSTPATRKKHVDVVHLKISIACPVESCPIKYSSRRSMVDHIKRGHASEEIFQELQCKECDYVAIEKRRLAPHIKLNHTTIGTKGAKKRRYNCEKCDYSTNYYTCIRRHRANHERPPCIVCGKNTLGGVWKPEDGDFALCWVHGQKKKYLVPDSRTFISTDHNNSQTSRVNPGISPLITGIAGDSVGKNANQKRDYVSATGHVNPSDTSVKSFCVDSDEPFICQYCGLGFKNGRNRDQHLKSIHLKIRYKCPVEGCGKEYAEKRNIVPHYNRVHADAAPALHCQNCDFQCSTMDVLQSHARVRHSVKQNRIPQASSAFGPSETLSGCK